MYFGNEAINVLIESAISSGISDVSNAISHLIKYSDERQRHKQSTSWVNTILAANKNLNDIEKRLKNSKTSYIKSIKKEYDNAILKEVNKELKAKAGFKIDKIPDQFSYEFLLDRDKVEKFLVDNVYDDVVMNDLESNKHIEIPYEIRKRCKRDFK